MYVKDYMQSIAITVSPHDLLSMAHRLMHDLFIRHLPVVTGDHELVGILTDRDVREASPSSELAMTDQERHLALQQMKVGDYMTHDACTVSPETALLEAATILLEQKFDCLPVVTAGRLEGMITVSDFVRVYVEQHDSVIF